MNMFDLTLPLPILQTSVDDDLPLPMLTPSQFLVSLSSFENAETQEINPSLENLDTFDKPIFDNDGEPRINDEMSNPDFNEQIIISTSHTNPPCTEDFIPTSGNIDNHSYSNETFLQKDINSGNGSNFVSDNTNDASNQIKPISHTFPPDGQPLSVSCQSSLKLPHVNYPEMKLTTMVKKEYCPDRVKVEAQNLPTLERSPSVSSPKKTKASNIHVQENKSNPCTILLNSVKVDETKSQSYPILQNFPTEQKIASQSLQNTSQSSHVYASGSKSSTYSKNLNPVKLEDTSTHNEQSKLASPITGQSHSSTKTSKSSASKPTSSTKRNTPTNSKEITAENNRAPQKLLSLGQTPSVSLQKNTQLPNRLLLETKAIPFSKKLTYIKLEESTNENTPGQSSTIATQDSAQSSHANIPGTKSTFPSKKTSSNKVKQTESQNKRTQTSVKQSYSVAPQKSTQSSYVSNLGTAPIPFSKTSGSVKSEEIKFQNNQAKQSSSTVGQFSPLSTQTSSQSSTAQASGIKYNPSSNKSTTAYPEQNAAQKEEISQIVPIARVSSSISAKKSTDSKATFERKNSLIASNINSSVSKVPLIPYNLTAQTYTPETLISPHTFSSVGIQDFAASSFRGTAVPIPHTQQPISGQGTFPHFPLQKSDRPSDGNSALIVQPARHLNRTDILPSNVLVTVGSKNLVVHQANANFPINTGNFADPHGNKKSSANKVNLSTKSVADSSWKEITPQKTQALQLLSEQGISPRVPLQKKKHPSNISTNLSLLPAQNQDQNSRANNLPSNVLVTVGSQRHLVHQASATTDMTLYVDPKENKKSAALILSEVPATDLPPGWTVQTKQRTSGRTKGTTDKYWFSPKLRKKFRSKVEVESFRSFLDSSANGDEKLAYEMFRIVRFGK